MPKSRGRTESKERAEFDKKREEIRKRLMENPTAEELARIQLQINALELWRDLGKEEHHDHDTHPHYDHEHNAV
jgi:hypothetical protein